MRTAIFLHISSALNLKPCLKFKFDNNYFSEYHRQSGESLGRGVNNLVSRVLHKRRGWTPCNTFIHSCSL